MRWSLRVFRCVNEVIARLKSCCGIMGIAGFAIALNNFWILLMIVPYILIISYGVINREEAYLESKFGEPYLDYKKRVRRWV